MCIRDRSYFANRLDMATSHVEMCIAEIVHRGYLVSKSDIFYILRFGATISPQRLKQERSFSRARVSCVPRQGIWKKSWARSQGWGARAPEVGSAGLRIFSQSENGKIALIDHFGRNFLEF